jgi:hypothetical protein
MTAGEWLTIPQWAAECGRSRQRAHVVFVAGRLPATAVRATPHGVEIRSGTPWPEALRPGRRPKFLQNFADSAA